jgi:hypothetical protein
MSWYGIRLCMGVIRLSEGFSLRCPIVSGKVWISGHLHPQGAQWNLKIGREPGLISISAREEITFGQMPLILLNINV